MYPRLPGYLLLFMMVLYPAVPELLKVKAVAFGLLLACIVIKYLFSRRLSLQRGILLGALFFCAIGLFWAFRGAVDSPAGARKQAQVYAMWPLVYTVLMAGLASARALVGLQRTMVTSAALLGLSGIGFIVSQTGFVPEFWFFNPFPSQDQLVTFSEGLMEIRIAGLTSIAYLIPFLFASVVVYSPDAFGARRLWLWIALVLQLALVFMSGKRALLVIVAAAPVIVLLLRCFLPTATSFAGRFGAYRVLLGVSVFLGGILFYLSAYHDFAPSRIPEMLAEGFAFTEASSANSRYLQFWALLEGWSQHPILGAGHGTNVSYIRSDTMPWSYELFYLAILYQTGLLGFFLYAAGIAWIYWMGTRIIRQGGTLAAVALSNLAGMTGVLIANGTNPYLVRFDGLWAIFIPVAVINCWLLRTPQPAPLVRPKEMQ